mmetsp:Transcript_9829/g.17889  ORF Transcript_9829/g.17889 Transcript_9829/m.17889 type:complete len:111 (+) Transcript_9829:1998-2330(+)
MFTRLHFHKFAETSVHIGCNERKVLFAFFAHCRQRNNKCLTHWAMVLSFNNMARGVKQIQQSITSNLGYQVASSTFERYKTKKMSIQSRNKPSFRSLQIWNQSLKKRTRI